MKYVIPSKSHLEVLINPQEIMKFENKYIHLILMGSIFSRNLPNPKNYSEGEISISL